MVAVLLAVFVNALLLLNCSVVRGFSSSFLSFSADARFKHWHEFCAIINFICLCFSLNSSMRVSWLYVIDAPNSFHSVSKFLRMLTYSVQALSLAVAPFTDASPAPPLRLGMVPMVLPPRLCPSNGSLWLLVSPTLFALSNPLYFLVKTVPK